MLHSSAAICSRARCPFPGSGKGPQGTPRAQPYGVEASSPQPHLILPREASVPSPTPLPAPRHLHRALQPVPQCELVSEPASPAPRATKRASRRPRSSRTHLHRVPLSSSHPHPHPLTPERLHPLPRVLPSLAPPEPAPYPHLHLFPPPLGRGRALASRDWEGPQWGD